MFAGVNPDQPGRVRRYEWCTQCGYRAHTDTPEEVIAPCGCPFDLQAAMQGKHVIVVSDEGREQGWEQLTEKGVADHLIAQIMNLMYGERV
jgi:hypothetical protein